MEITPSALKALRTSLSKQFRDAYSQTPSFYQQIATVVPSSSSQNDYGWMAKLPQMREWLGEKVIHNLLAHSYSLKNKTFELSFAVPREDIEDDNLGIYSEISAAHGEAVAKHPDSLLVTILKDGEATLCFDGQYFFDTDHPVNPKDSGLGTYSNYSSTSKALSQANALSVRAAMMAFKGEDGLPLGINPKLLVVPPALEGTALQIAKAQTIEVGSNGASVDNITRGMFDVLVLPELAGEDTTWYLLDVSRRIKPFVFQTRRAPAFVAKSRMDDDNVIWENEYRFTADARYNAGYALPFLAYKAVA